MQSSLETWLKKPSTVTAPPKEFSGSTSILQHDCEKNSPSTAQPTANKHHVQDRSKQISTALDENPIAAFSHQPPLHPNVRLQAPSRNDISRLKRLNGLLLPIPYPDAFYREILADPVAHSLTLLAFWHDPPSGPSDSSQSPAKGQLIGAIRCRILPAPLVNTTSGSSASSSTGPPRPMLYISTLALLSPYRGLGVATHMLDAVARRAAREHSVGGVGAHVWASNAAAREWYRRRGFREVASERGYYRRLEPDGDAVVVWRDVRVLDLMGG